MSEPNLDYAAVRRNVEKNIRRQKRLNRLIFFWTHLFLFVVSMFVVWGTVLIDSQLRAALFNGGVGGALIVILPTILGAFTILIHVAALFAESAVGEKAMRERLLTSEIGEALLRKGLADGALLEKPKRRASAIEAERVLLSDDGELIPLDRDMPLAQRARTGNASDT